MTALRLRSGSRDRSRGQGLTEFALVFPVFALLLFGLIDIGRLVYTHNAIAEGAREGGRWGSVQGRSLDATARTSIGSHAVSSLTAVTGATASVSCEDGAGTTLAACTTGDILVVTIRVQVHLLTPVIGQMLGTQTYTATTRTAVSN